MILTLLILLATQGSTTQGPATLGAIEGLSPEAAGEIVLANHEHGPITKVVAPRQRGMDPPGWLRGELVERAVAGAEGCTRRRWNVAFSQGPDVATSQARLESVSATTEIGLSGPAGCPGDGYTSLNGDIDPAQAFVALRYLDDLRFRGAKAQIACSDETASHLCAGSEKIRQALAKLTPWAVMREDGQTIFWLGAPGQIVTEVRYRLDRPGRVTVTRAVPAPF